MERGLRGNGSKTRAVSVVRIALMEVFIMGKFGSKQTDQGHFLGNGATVTIRPGWIGKDGAKIFRHPYYFLKTQLSLVIGNAPTPDAQLFFDGFAF